MEPLKASMILTTAGSFAPNGSGVIVSSDPSRRTSSSFTIRTTATAASRGKPPCKSFKVTASGRSSRLPGSNYLRSALIFPREPFPSSVSSALTNSWTSLENISLFPSLSSIPMSGLKSSPACIRSSSTTAMNWSPPSPTSYRPGWTQALETTVTKKRTKGVLFTNPISLQGSYPQPLRSPAPQGRRSGAMDNFRSGSKLSTMFCYINLLQKCQRCSAI